MKLLFLVILPKIIVLLCKMRCKDFTGITFSVPFYPVVVYHKDGDALQSVSYCIISDDNKHDVGMVYQVQKEIITDLKLRFPYLSHVTYFSDGCAGQYKNCKNLYNLCHHKPDYNKDAKWLFFATSHGKQLCNGLWGKVKRLVSNASLHCVNNSQIINCGLTWHVSVLQKNV